jgi:GT2 family glycosyltransferase
MTGGEDRISGAAAAGKTVSVLAVTFHDLPLLERALGVFRTEPDVEIVIANNDPSQDVRSWANEHAPGAQVIDMAFDSGYPNAMNAAIAASRGEFVVLLDSDLFVSRSYVSEIVGFLAAHPEVGAAGGKLFRYDLETDRETEVIDTAGIRLGRNRRIMARGEGEVDRGQYDRAEPMFGVDGAGMVLRRSALDSVAIDGEFFDSSFVAHKEDADLCWRLRLAGWQIWYVPSAVGRHGRTTRGLGTRSYLASILALHRNERAKRESVRVHAMRNQWLMLTKNEDRQNLLRDLPLILGRELGVLLYNLVFEPRTLLAVRQYVRLFGPTLRKRRIIRQRQTLAPADMRSWLG